MGRFRRLLRDFYGGIPRPLALRLLAMPFLLSLIDLAVTLYFQPEDYWRGNRSVVIEGNPIARWAFSAHPLMIVPGFVGWYALVIPLIFKTPAWIGLRVHVFLVLGHGVTISGWLLRYGGIPWGLLALCWFGMLVAALRFVAPFLVSWEERGKSLVLMNLDCHRGI